MINMDLPSFIKKILQNGKYVTPNSDVFSQKITEHIDNVMKNMIDTIAHMPYLNDIKGIIPTYNVIRIMCISCVGLIICYKGVKVLFNYDESQRAENKNIIGRLAYSVAFGSLSIPLIDVLIKLNNTLINVLTSNFALSSIVTNIGKNFGVVISILLLLLELLCTIKIMVDFWMRMAELVFMGVISPIVFTLWINEQWSGYLKSWWRRIITLIFAQFAQILVLVVYSMLVTGLLLGGTFNGICLSIATLLLVSNTPRILYEFLDSNNTGYGAVKKTMSNIRSIKNTFTKLF